MILCTRNSADLATLVSEKLELPLVKPNVRCFNNKEICVSFRGYINHATVIAATETDNDWIELFLLLDALRSTKDITLCLTYMGYARQDQQNPNESMAARMFAGLLETMNISRCIMIDNHSEPLLRIPTQHISARTLFERDIADKYNSLDQIVLVSPDLGGVRRAYDMSRSLKCDFIICNKAKTVFGELKRIDPIGSVKDKLCILIDDMIDSGSTICHAAEALIRAGARGVVAYCTHGVLSKGSLERLASSDISEIVLTDSLQKDIVFPSKIRKISIDSLLVDTIRSIVQPICCVS
ncbi:MAG: ribose-phosphate diphosphokinase [Alphaproteobacteria bacterium]|nr:ribose-phosphate diphosphokinase [Alphaproteobacteria bacterium]